MAAATPFIAVAAKLKATTAVTNLVSTRVFPQLTTQEPTFPMLVMSILGAEAGATLGSGSNSLKRYTARIDCYAETELAAGALGKVPSCPQEAPAARGHPHAPAGRQRKPPSVLARVLDRLAASDPRLARSCDALSAEQAAIIRQLDDLRGASPIERRGQVWQHDVRRLLDELCDPSALLCRQRHPLDDAGAGGLTSSLADPAPRRDAWDESMLPDFVQGCDTCPDMTGEEQAALSESAGAELARLRRLAIVDELLTTLVGTLDVREVFARVSEGAGRVLPHDAISLPLVTEDREHVIPFATAGSETDAVPGAHAIPESERSLFTDTWEFEVVDDMLAEPERHPFNAAVRYRSMLRVPICLQGQVVALLAVMSRAAAAYRPPDAAVARRIADYVALALSHQLFFEILMMPLRPILVVLLEFCLGLRCPILPVLGAVVHAVHQLPSV